MVQPHTQPGSPAYPAPAAPPAEEGPAWDGGTLRGDPHERADKARRVRDMFTAIAGKYDLNNRVHSFGQDQRWRQATVRAAGLKAGHRVVDVACGTGDLTVAFADAMASLGSGAGAEAGRPPVVGIDYTLAMLPIAVTKTARRFTEHSAAVYLQADAMRLPLPDASADVLSIAFGIRNVADPELALSEFKRVLRPGGRLLILEFSEPKNRLIGFFDRVYRKGVMPWTATLLAGDRSGAYRYLPRSVSTFQTADELADSVERAGFDRPTQKPLTFGVATLHRAIRP
ncbi:MAG: bifunctional demethylmenaquinone methyltransferase/2-methoxy-6-polyprenyl-1,4-benzoquinol methylase UbiE [Planctomycetota bacterium]